MPKLLRSKPELIHSDTKQISKKDRSQMLLDFPDVALPDVWAIATVHLDKEEGTVTKRVPLAHNKKHYIIKF